MKGSAGNERSGRQLYTVAIWLQEYEGFFFLKKKKNSFLALTDNKKATFNVLVPYTV